MRVSFIRQSQFRFLLLCLSGVLLILTLGCRAEPISPQASGTSPAPAAPNNTTLTLWHSLADIDRKTLETLAQDFHKVYPDLTVTPVYVGSRDDLTKQMTAAIAMGNAPDLVLANRSQISNFAQQGGLYPLETFMSDADLGLSKEDKTDFLNGALNLGKYPTLNSQTYGFPFDQEAFVLFYNTGRLESVKQSRPPQTWNQFAENAAALTKEPEYAWAMRANADTFQAMLTSRGSALLTDDETRALFNERAGLASLKLLADLDQNGAAALASSDDRAQQEFASGKAAFYMGWTSELDKLQALQKQSKTAFEIGIAPLPQLEPKEPWLLTRGDLFGVSSAPTGRTDLQRARNAWFFVRWVTAPTQSAQWVRETNAIPLRASTLKFVAPDLNKNVRFRQIAAAFSNVLPGLAPQPAPFYMNTVEQQVSALWQQALEPKADLAAMLDNAARRVNDILAIKP